MDKIINLFNDLQINLSFDEIKGEITLNENIITWNYNLDMKDNESEPYYNEDDEYCFDFKPSIEEQLNDVYNEDIVIVENIIDDVSVLDDWKITEPEIEDENISFKISLK